MKTNKKAQVYRKASNARDSSNNQVSKSSWFYKRKQEEDMIYNPFCWFNMVLKK
jgi:hypothetical protein